jgi:hypothetical protein
MCCAAVEGRNFVSLGLRPDVLRSMRYYCQIVVEDVTTSEILLNVRTNRVQRENGQTNIVWNEELYLYVHPTRTRHLRRARSLACLVVWPLSPRLRDAFLVT